MRSLAVLAVGVAIATVAMIPAAFGGSNLVKPVEAPQQAALVRVAPRRVAPAPKPSPTPKRVWLAKDARHPLQPRDIDQIIEREALRNGVDPLLIATIIKYESAGDPHARSWVGAQGLMQMMPETAAEMGVRNARDPEDNIRGGARYFGLMMRQFGNPKLALAAYNAGPGAVMRYGGVPPYSETRNYVKKIYREYARRSYDLGIDPTGLPSGS